MNNPICDQVLVQNNNVEAKESSFEWVLKNFGLNYRKVHGCLESPRFSFDIDPEVDWMLDLQYKDADNDLITVYLKKGTTARKKIYVNLSILNANKDVERSLSTVINKEMTVDEEAFSIFLNYNLINNIASNNTITIRFKVAYYNHVSSSIFLAYKLKDKLLESDRFEKFLGSGKFSDARIIVDDYVFNVHKCILSAGSAYFSAMFENEMKESKDSKVKITDVSREVMQEVLRFIYAGKVDNLETLKMDLFVAADKYMIEGLKILCEEALIQDLKVENILDMLKFVERYDSENLKTAAFNFFHVHNKEIITLSEYETSLKTYSTSTVAAMFKQLTF